MGEKREPATETERSAATLCGPEDGGLQLGATNNDFAT